MFSDIEKSLFYVVSLLINEVEYFISAPHYFFIISGIIVMLSIIHVRERNIGYFPDSIKMQGLIMQHNPSILVSLYHNSSYIIISNMI